MKYFNAFFLLCLLAALAYCQGAEDIPEQANAAAPAEKRTEKRGIYGGFGYGGGLGYYGGHGGYGGHGFGGSYYGGHSHYPIAHSAYYGGHGHFPYYGHYPYDGYYGFH